MYRLSRRDIYLPALTALLFVLNQFYVRNYVAPAFLRNYFDDLLCMPLVLSWAKLILNLLPLKNVPRRIPLYFILTALLLFSVYFELLLPHFHKGFTADLLDVAAYAAGCILFSLWEYANFTKYKLLKNKNLNKRSGKLYERNPLI